MWIYHLQEEGKDYVVGFYQPNGRFWTIGMTHDRRLAAEWVNYLNGGSHPMPVRLDYYDGIIDLADDHVEVE